MNRDLSRSRRALYTLAAAAVSVLVPLLLLEGGLRLFYSGPVLVDFLEVDGRYGSVNRKSYRGSFTFPEEDFVMEVATNSWGHRGEEYDLEGEYDGRVLLLGDSFTFGYGVNAPEVFGSRLGALLEEDGGRYLIVNAGVMGWGTLQQTAYGRDHLEIFRPDIVVLTFCGNDPGDDEKYRSSFAAGQERPPDSFVRKWLKGHSRLYTVAFVEYRRMLHNRRAREVLEKDAGARVDRQSAGVLSERRWRATLESIGEFHRRFMGFNPEGVLLVQATAPWDEDVKEHLSTLSKGRSLRYVDLSEAAGGHAPGELKLDYDSHWSALMHGLSARLLHEAIAALPAPSAEHPATGEGGLP